MTETIQNIETPVSSETLYQGRVISLRKDFARLPSGLEVLREVVTHPGGAVVFATLPDGKVLFVEQYRYALGHSLLELPAGKLEPNEPPALTIRRELLEETGYQADNWEEMGAVYTSPGFCNEKIWLYKASGLTPAETLCVNGDGEEETLRLHQLSVSEIKEKVKNHQIMDAKTLCLLGLCLPEALS
ncbi:MAG: NUDIX hydrolase [Cyanobacteria bacterium]|nr:NUDIX hydrolase [Cyanobacteriota bacterium]